METKYIEADRFSCEDEGDKLKCRVKDDIEIVDKASFKDGAYVTADSKKNYLFSYGKDMKCVVTEIKKGFTKGQKILACAKPNERMDWGFDNSGMDSGKEFDKFLKKHKFAKKECAGYKDFVTGKVSDKGKTHCHFENKDKIRILTEKPGKDGYLGYVGVTIPSDKTDKWEKVREDFVKMADIKEENPNDNPYISDDWLKGKK